MELMRWIRFTIIVTLMFLIVFGIANSAYVTQYMTVIKHQQVMNSVSRWEAAIKEYAEKHNEYPIEPKVDRVWKLIPGYNGWIIDEKTTLEQLKTNHPSSLEKIHYIWKEAEPKQQINDLGDFPIYRGNPHKPQVSFMINVSWGTEFIEPILQIFKEEEIKATFFLDGSWLKKHPELAKKIASEGHEIGNHAYSHPQMSRLPNERIKEEIKKTEDLIRSVTHQSSHYFAPPSGDYDQRVVQIARDFNMFTVLWTLDTVDWQKPSPNTIIQRIIPKVNNGHLILMHPTDSTVEALPELIRQIKEKGLMIGTVNETLSTKRILNVETHPIF